VGATSESEPQIFQVRITLKGVAQPPVWRRMLLPAEITLDHLHHAIQAVMGWHGYHMHVFTAGSEEYGVADSELGHRDERHVALSDLISDPGDRLSYTYDFGDDWEHELRLEEVHVPEPESTYPICIAGRGACPPEDCGGVGGYANLRAVMADPTNPAHTEMLIWLELESGTDFDPGEFDVDAANESLAYISVSR
jgi:hypothetical protein